MPRQLRIAGDEGEPAFLRFDNRELLRLEPASLDIEVSAQKQSAYNKLSYNELAMQLYNMGFFRPEMSDQALTALEMMDFKGRENLRRRLRENGDLLQRLELAEFRLKSLLELAAPAHSVGRDGKPAGSPADSGTGGARTAASFGGKPAPRLRVTDSIGAERKKNAIAEKARARAAAATQPR